VVLPDCVRVWSMMKSCKGSYSLAFDRTSCDVVVRAVMLLADAGTHGAMSTICANDEARLIGMSYPTARRAGEPSHQMHLAEGDQLTTESNFLPDV
jgi:hypothetical protein